MVKKQIKTESTKLVIAISSRALFNLDHSHQIFKDEGIEAYARHQQENEQEILEPGVGFTLVKKLLKLNSKKTPIDVILLSRNSADTGLRIFNSIEHYGLNISRAAFTRGESTHPFVGAFEADLFLSSNYNDVQKALKSGYAAASIIESKSNHSHPNF
jgi:5'-nucleotidase